MPALFDNKLIIIDTEEITITIQVYAQPSTTSIYLDGEFLSQEKGDFSYSIHGKTLKKRKVRIHTSVQDKNENTDDIRVEHRIEHDGNMTKRTVNTTASEAGDIFDIFTDLNIF
ncbi:MAG: hypothetical protein R8G66_01300 [Cytophagales bacterium]|nr:hypothetical protein [Cytophagales bacterium]